MGMERFFIGTCRAVRNGFGQKKKVALPKLNMGRCASQAIPTRGSQTFKDIINHGATVPKITPEIILVTGENINIGRDTGLPGARVDLALSLKLDLGIGPTGEWVVHKVEILSPTKEQKAQPNPKTLINQPKPNKPISVKSWKPTKPENTHKQNKGPPKPIFEWRPRYNTGQSVGVGPSGTKSEAESPLVNLELSFRPTQVPMMRVPRKLYRWYWYRAMLLQGPWAKVILLWIGHGGSQRSGFWNSKMVNDSEFHKASDLSRRRLMIGFLGEFYN